MDSPRRTRSGLLLKSTYSAGDVSAEHQMAADTLPGQPPFLRGAYDSMYRTKPWRIFQLSGYGSPDEMAARLRFLLAQGETGFIMKRDRVTNDHMLDVDDPEVVARREDVGQSGAVLLTASDVQAAIVGVPIDRCYAHPGAGVVQAGPFCLASYWTAATRRGIDYRHLAGTGQSDFFLTYVGCMTPGQIPPRAGLRLNCDLIEFCATSMPRWVPVSIAGYNGADSGLNAWQEVGAVLANAIEYLDALLARGRIDATAIARAIGGISLRTSMAFFEDIAKLRTIRKMWAELLTRRYGVSDPRVLRLRIHVVTAGSAMTYQQPLNNIIRGTLMGLAAALGGAQSLGISGYDEALSIPSDHAHQMSIRTQQVLQHECEGLVDVADPLGGSYFIEALGTDLEMKALEFLAEIESRGGFIEVVDTGWLQRQAAENILDERVAFEEGDRTVVGVNRFQDDVTPFDVDGFVGGLDAWDEAMSRLTKVRSSRDSTVALARLAELGATCRSSQNIVPAMMEAVGADATVGEIGAVLRDAFGVWSPPI